MAPLFDSVDKLIDLLSAAPDANDPSVSFLVMVITDGEENSSMIKGPALAAKIRNRQATDRWTFVFRVPFGGKAELVRLGIPAGNIQEWEQTEEGYREATQVTTRSVTDYSPLALAVFAPRTSSTPT